MGTFDPCGHTTVPESSKGATVHVTYVREILYKLMQGCRNEGVLSLFFHKIHASCNKKPLSKQLGTRQANITKLLELHVKSLETLGKWHIKIVAWFNVKLYKTM